MGGFFQTNAPKTTSTKLAHYESLYAWWLNQRGFLGFYFTTNRARNLILDAGLSKLDDIISANIQKNHAEQIDQLTKLLSHLTSWKLHNDCYFNSHIHNAVAHLNGWLTTRLQALEALKSIEQPYDPCLYRYRTEQFLTKPKTKTPPLPKHLSHILPPRNHQDLYRWWMQISKLGVLHRRTKETKVLDNAIKWYSTSVVLNQVECLTDIASCIDSWKSLREGKSNRFDAVLRLEEEITGHLELLNKCDTEYLPAWRRPGTAFLYLVYLLQDFAVDALGLVESLDEINVIF